jgi:hypothetical protein
MLGGRDPHKMHAKFQYDLGTDIERSFVSDTDT